jgi:hypothetical protein
MNAPKSMDKETAQTPIFDPFPEPQTMPKGWDFSGLMLADSLSTVTEPSYSSEFETD